MLLLRTFGEDGDIRVGNPRDGVGFEKNTLESVITAVATSHGMSVRALHNEKARFIPHGVDYFATDNELWFDHFLDLAHHAIVIAVLSVDALGLGHSFKTEIASLRSTGHSSKVVVLFPPTLGRDRHAKKDGIFRALGWTPPPALPLVAYRPANDARVFCHPSLGPADDSLADRYALGIESAVRLIHGARN